MTHQLTLESHCTAYPRCVGVKLQCFKRELLTLGLVWNVSCVLEFSKIIDSYLKSQLNYPVRIEYQILGEVEVACRAFETMMINGKCFKMTVPWIWTCPLHWTGANLWCSPERSQSAVSGPWSPAGRYLPERSPWWSCQEYQGSILLKCLKICRYVCRFVHKVHL